MNVHREMLKTAWDEFISKGTVSNGVIREEILQSWQRCKTNGLDPYTQAINHNIGEAEGKAILAENRQLIETAHPFLESLFKFIRSLEMVIFLTDRDGVILDALGEGDIWNYCQSKNAVICSSFNERFSGTTAPTMALKLDTPYQMVAEEHYLQIVHVASCAAAPIHDEFNNIIGALNITSSYETALEHPHTLGMIISAAKVIENLNQSTVTTQYLRSAMETMTDGLIIVNAKKVITHINQAAERILEVDAERIKKMSLRTVIKNREFLNALTDNKPLYDYEIILNESKSKSRCLVTLNPILGSTSQKIGSLVILKEFKVIQKLMKQVVGLQARYTFSDIWGESPKIRETIELAKRISRTGTNLVITGESGTGKEMLAQSIHNFGPFAAGPFLGVNCAAIPHDLIESELFGYEAGTFTGALTSGKPGRLELANGGTLFLDEVNGMSLDMQAKLLRVLEEKRFQRLGGKQTIPLEARLVTATNKNLEEEVEKGNFRSDLYYRLNVVEIRIPPLRERGEDIAIIIEKLIQEISNRLGKEVTGISSEALSYLKNKTWPGNVRQLKNWVERAVTLAEKPFLTVEDFPQESLSKKSGNGPMSKSIKEKSVQPMSLTEMEKETIKAIIEECGGNISRASQKLGITRATLYRKLNRYDLAFLKKVSW